jgi:hypothetical protein
MLSDAQFHSGTALGIDNCLKNGNLMQLSEHLQTPVNGIKNEGTKTVIKDCS